jgi:hypothetical protein
MATEVSDKYRSLSSDLIALESRSDTIKSGIMQSKFFKSAHSPSYLKSLSGGPNQSTTITQKEYHIYAVTAIDTRTDAIMGKGFSFSVPVVNSNTANATHLHMLKSTQAFLRSYQNDQISNCVNRAVTLVQANTKTKTSAQRPDQLQRTFATPANIFDYYTPDSLTCCVGRMHPRCTENCLTDYRACDQIKEIFPGSIRCMDIRDNGTLITIDQTTGFADYGQESVTHHGFCTEGADNAKIMNTITQISQPFAFKTVKGPLTNVEIENRVLYLQQSALSNAFPDFKLNKTLSTKCHVKMIHTKLSNCMAMRLTTVVRSLNTIKLVVSSHYAFQKNIIVHPCEIKYGTLTHTSAREPKQAQRPINHVHHAINTFSIRHSAKIVKNVNHVHRAKDKSTHTKENSANKFNILKINTALANVTGATRSIHRRRSRKHGTPFPRSTSVDTDSTVEHCNCEQGCNCEPGCHGEKRVCNCEPVTSQDDTTCNTDKSSPIEYSDTTNESKESPTEELNTVDKTKESSTEELNTLDEIKESPTEELNTVDETRESPTQELNTVDETKESLTQEPDTTDEIKILPSLTSDEALLAVIDTGFLLHSVHSGEKFENNMKSVIQGIRETCLLSCENNRNSI